MPMSASPRNTTRPARPAAPPAPYFAFAAIASAMPRSANTLAMCTPLWPPPTGLEQAIDLAASIARLKLSTEERSGFGVPFGTATPIDDLAISLMLPEMSLPCPARSRAPEAETMATSAGAPSPSCFSSRSDGPRVTSSRWPVARSKAGDSSSNTVFMAVVDSTLISAWLKSRSPGIQQKERDGLRDHSQVLPGQKQHCELSDSGHQLRVKFGRGRIKYRLAP